MLRVQSSREKYTKTRYELYLLLVWLFVIYILELEQELRTTRDRHCVTRARCFAVICFKRPRVVCSAAPSTSCVVLELNS